MNRRTQSFTRCVLSLTTGIAMATSAVIAVPSAVMAAPASDTAAADARELYDKGRVAFDAGKFDKAAELFDAAYDKAKNPNLRYNAAIAYEEAGDLRTARRRLQQYRDEAPASEHADIDKEIARVDSLIELAEGTDEPAQQQDDPPQGWTGDGDEANEGSSQEDGKSDNQPKRDGRGAMIATGAIAGTAGLLALGFGLAALQRKNAVEDECSFPEGGADQPLCRRSAKGLEDDRKTFALITDIGIGVAAASTVAFTVLLIRNRRMKKEETARTAVAPMIGGHTAGASFTARF